MCKKNDGRKWFCKQRAKLPHKLCEHHLRLSRSYKELLDQELAQKLKKEKEKKETRNFNSEYHCYRTGGKRMSTHRTVVPPGGKRRHSGNANDGTNDKYVGEKMEIINVPDGDEEDEVQVLDYKVVSGSNDEEKLKTGAKKERKLVKYSSMDSLAGTLSKLCSILTAPFSQPSPLSIVIN